MPAWAGLCACFVSFPETMIHPRMGFMPLLLLTGLTCASLTKSIVEFLPMPSVADGSLLGAKGGRGEAGWADECARCFNG